MAVFIRQVEWNLDNLASDRPAGRAEPHQLRETATMLRQVAAHLDSMSGIVPGDVDQRPP